MISEFKAFLLKHNVMALAIGFILGAAVGKVVTATVNDLVMPLVGMVTPGGEWREITLQAGGSKFLVGNFLGAVVDFVIIALVVFLAGKTLLKPGPAPATKNCPACTEAIAQAATRCKYCTQAV